MTPEQLAWQRLDALASRLEPGLAAVFRRVLRQLAQRLQLAPLVRMLDTGDVDAVLRYVFDTPEARAIVQQLRTEYASGIVRTMPSILSALPRVPGVLALSIRGPVTSPALIAAVRRWEEVTFNNVVAEMRAGVRAAVEQGVMRGQGPRAIATALKTQTGQIGLTAYDQRIINSFRAVLERGDRTAALGRELRDKRFDRTLAKLGDKQLSPAQIDKMVEAYRAKLVKLRATTFARTNAVQAANDANRATWQAAIDDGSLPHDEVFAYWVVANDERLCPRCEGIPELNPDGRHLDEPFDTPEDGAVLGPTLHPNCRCTLWLRHEPITVAKRAAPGRAAFFTPAGV